MNAFDEVWKTAKESSKRMLNRSMTAQTNNGLKYVHVVYSRGSFYYDGNMYHTDDGSLITELNCVNTELLRIAKQHLNQDILNHNQSYLDIQALQSDKGLALSTNKTFSDIGLAPLIPEWKKHV